MNEKITIDKKEFIKSMQKIGLHLPNRYVMINDLPSELVDRELVYSYCKYLMDNGKISYYPAKYTCNHFICSFYGENSIGIYYLNGMSRLQKKLIFKYF